MRLKLFTVLAIFILMAGLDGSSQTQSKSKAIQIPAEIKEIMNKARNRQPLTDTDKNKLQEWSKSMSRGDNDAGHRQKSQKNSAARINDGNDDTGWQGTVKVVRTDHREINSKGSTSLGEVGQRVNRYQSVKTATYAGFNILPNTKKDSATTTWRGPANVDLTIDRSKYNFETAVCRKKPCEMGYDLKTAGSTKGKGEVKFYRYPDRKSPGKARCKIEVDALDNSWRDRPELIVWEVGRSWKKGTMSGDYNKSVKERQILAPDFIHIEFDCDPKAVSYNGQIDKFLDSSRSMKQTVTWNISSGGGDSEAVIIPPDNYGTWMPQAGENEDTPASIIKIRTRIHRKGQPRKPSPQVAKFRFQLVDVSKEKGVCLNWPSMYDIKKEESYDLKIQDKLNPELEVAPDGQSAVSKENMKESTVTISSYDWGAYGRVKVTAVYNDGRVESAHLEGNQSKDSLSIPKDENDNRIADFWEERYKGGKSDAAADDDPVPAGKCHEGDGLSLYEEYRGFRVQGKHIRTSPILKDLFIYDKDKIGLGYFSKSGLTTHLIDHKEYGREPSDCLNNNVINFNRGFASRGPQHILTLINEKRPEGKLGSSSLGTPKNSPVTVIDAARCLKDGGQQALDKAIAHELAHGCNVRHHGDGDYLISGYDFLREDGSWGSINEEKWVSVKGGEESGEETCIMRYQNHARIYETPKGIFRWKKEDGSLRYGTPTPLQQVPAAIFCKSKKGTGHAGNATFGECQKQFCVNDSKH